jgi:hypothetical protein
MAVLIERACTPIFSSKMDTDSNSDGVIDGINPNKYTGSGIIATFALDDSAQKITITDSSTASAGAHAHVQSNSITVTANTAYSFQILLRGTVTTGTFITRVTIGWYNASSNLIRSDNIIQAAPSSYWSLVKGENLIAPANSSYVIIFFRAQIQAAGDTGSVWFRNVQLEPANTCSTFTDLPRAADAQGLAIEPLSDTFSISFAVAPNFEYNNVPAGGAVWMRLSSLNSEIRILENNGGIIQAAQRIGSEWTYVELPAIQHARYQIIKIILTRAGNNTYLYARLNNGTIISATATTQPSIAGFNTLSLNTVGLESNSFIESVTLLRNNVITTVEAANVVFDDMNAEMVINGGFESGSDGWTLQNDAVIENGMLKGIATQDGNISTIFATQNIKVLPNNRYQLKARLIGHIDSDNKPKVTVEQLDIIADKYIQETEIVSNSYDQIWETTFITSVDTYFVNIILQSTGSGTFYWDDISVQLVN